MIEPAVFARWMRTFAVRFGKPLDRDASAAYYAELSRQLDTAQFDAAALRVFGTHEYNTWPAVAAFVEADRTLRGVGEGEIRATLAMIDRSRALALPAASRSTTLDAFHAAYERELADCPHDPPSSATRALDIAPSPYETDPEVIARRERARQIARARLEGWHPEPHDAPEGDETP